MKRKLVFGAQKRTNAAKAAIENSESAS